MWEGKYTQYSPESLAFHISKRARVVDLERLQGLEVRLGKAVGVWFNILGPAILRVTLDMISLIDSQADLALVVDTTVGRCV